MVDLKPLDISIYDQLRSSQLTLDFMYCFSEALGLRVEQHGVVLIRTKYCYLFLQRNLVVVSLKTTTVEIFLHTNVRDRNYNLFVLLLLNA